MPGPETPKGGEESSEMGLQQCLILQRNQRKQLNKSLWVSCSRSRAGMVARFPGVQGPGACCRWETMDPSSSTRARKSGPSPQRILRSRHPTSPPPAWLPSLPGVPGPQIRLGAGEPFPEAPNCSPLSSCCPIPESVTGKENGIA